MNSNPTWYDILGVTPDATPDEIKAAWRAATDKFEPGSGTGQFRLFNEAADVLLDPDRRAAYDAELAPDVEPTADVEPVETPTPDVEPVETPTPDAVPTPDVEPVETPEARSGGLLGALGRLGNVALAVLAVLTVGALVLAVVLAVRIQDRVAVADAGPEATAAAEQALTAVLSYDYRQMEEDRDRAVDFLTPKYEKEYRETFALLTEGPDGAPGGAVKTKAVVTADVLDTAVVDADSDRVRVVAFVNQSSVKGDAAPAIFQNRVVATMVKRGDDWLVDGIKSY